MLSNAFEKRAIQVRFRQVPFWKEHEALQVEEHSKIHSL